MNSNEVTVLKTKTYQQKWEMVVKCGKFFNIFESQSLKWEIGEFEFFYRNIRVQG